MSSEKFQKSFASEQPVRLYKFIAMLFISKAVRHTIETPISMFASESTVSISTAPILSAL